MKTPLMIDAWINKPSYQIGEELQIYLDVSSDEGLLRAGSNINVDIFRVTKERNNFAFGFGHICCDKENPITIKTNIHESFQEGLYLICGLRLIIDDNPNNLPHSITPKDISKLFFWVSTDLKQNLSISELTDKINQIEAERSIYNNTVIITESAIKVPRSGHYKVLIFCVGCLIHAPQNMEGYVIQPLGTGFNYTHMLDAVNSYSTVKYGLRLTEIESIRTSFSSATPLFVVDFADVKAIDYTDAANYCSREAEKIFTVLAYDREQRPNSFATVIIDQNSGESWHGFNFPGYRGNFASNFNPSFTANTLDRLLPILNSSPWFDLIMRIYADAKSEINPHYAFLKFWSILEMISKKEIPDNTIELKYPNGNQILNPKGNVERTTKALGKAYKYAFDLHIPPSFNSLGGDVGEVIFETYQDATADPNYNKKAKLITLWDTLSAFYEIRNSTAHSGKFDPATARNGTPREKLAADLWEIEHQTFLREIQNMMKYIVSQQLEGT